MTIARASRLVLILAVLPLAPRALAQDATEPSATLRLLSQTAWTTPDEPMLHLAIAIRNDGDSTIQDPQIVWTIGPKVESRVQYEAALSEGPILAASADTESLAEDLPPGAAAQARFPIDVSETGVIGSSNESAVYPLRIQLTSESQEIAAITTAAIHLVQEPEQPIRFSWWTEIAAPIAFAPDGSLIDEGFESILEAGGGIAGQVEALADLVADAGASSGMDLIVSPAALDQLRQTSDGYKRRSGGSVGENGTVPRIAASTLRLLRAIATDPQVRMFAMPFAAPRLPALLSSSLRTNLADQWRVGDETFERLVGERPDPTVARPPGLAFDQATIDALYARGATTILGAPDSVPRPAQPSGFALPPAATLSTSGGGRVAIVLPDPGTQAMLTDPQLLEDPVRTAQAVLGELATIWREQPVPPPPTIRGLALDLPPDLPAAIWSPLARRLAGAPFLRFVHAEDLPDDVQPPPEPAALERQAPEGFSADYVSDLSAGALDVSAVAAMLEQPAGDAESLQRAILYAEASQYIGNEGSGRMWIDSVNGVTDQMFEALAPDTSRVLTFTSRSGTIPLRMGDPRDRVLNVTVQLASGRLEFLDGSSRSVRLDRANKVITFEAEFKAAGPTSIDVLVRAPSGFVLSRSVLVVRSTAVNPIALVITVGAGLILVGLWSRRLFRRRSP